MIAVLDASVLIKWFTEEADSKTAIQFKEKLLEGKIDIIIPDLALYEIANVLRFKTGVPEKAVTSAIPSLFTLGIEIITPSPKLIKDAIHLSYATGLSVYDCVYLALANELTATLITADKRIVNQAEPLSKVKLLG